MANFTRSGFSKLLLGLGILLLVGGVVGPYYTAEAAQGHETTEGTVLSSDVEVVFDQQAGERKNYPVVEYEYTVDGQQYTNNRMYLQSGSCTPDETVCGVSEYDSNLQAVREANNYPEGETVEVHYDPDDPTTSYLESVRSFPSIEHIILGFLSIGATGLGIAGLLGLPIQVLLPFDLEDQEDYR